MKKTVLTLLLLATAFVCSEAKTRKTLFVIVDGIPADCIERLKPHTIMDTAAATWACTAKRPPSPP